MTLYDFIFIKKSPGKYYRHIAFWIAQYLFWTFWALAFFISLTETLRFGLVLNGAFILHAAYTYSIVYYFSPKYFENKQYVKFSIAILILSLFAYILYIPYMLLAFNGIKESEDQQLLMTWYFTMNFIINGPPVVCAMFLTCKILKNYYIKMAEKQILIKENANAELQLLKAQVHPHFLFNTLNNIYSFTLDKSPEAGNLILKLKDTTRYMVYECDVPFVPLQKEIKMLKDYIELEKVRYGDRLDLVVMIDGNYEDKIITPLLLIPFVENSFKHGASKLLKSPWIQLSVQVDETVLHFTLINNKPPDRLVNNQRGIGLCNVKKRLELLYPNSHLLTIESTVQTFTVNMQVPLQKLSDE